MQLFKKIGDAGKRLVRVATGGVCALAIMAAALPPLVSSAVNRMLSRVAEKRPVEFTLMHVGLTTSYATFHCQRPHDNGRMWPSSRAGLFVLRYNPLRLLTWRVKEVVIRDIDVEAVSRDGVLSMPDVEALLEAFAGKDGAPHGGFSLKSVKPVFERVGRIRLMGAVTVDAESGVLRLPFDVATGEDSVKIISGRSGGKKWDSRTTAAGIVKMGGMQLDIKVLLDPEAEQIAATVGGYVDGDSLPLILRKSIPPRTKAYLGGALSATLDGPKVKALDLMVSAPITMGDAKLSPVFVAKGADNRIAFSLKGLEMNGISARIEDGVFDLDAGRLMCRPGISGAKIPAVAGYVECSIPVTAEQREERGGVSATLEIPQISCAMANAAKPAQGMPVLGLTNLVASVKIPSGGKLHGKVKLGGATFDGHEIATADAEFAQTEDGFDYSGSVNAAGIAGRLAGAIRKGAGGSSVISNAFIVEKQPFDAGRLAFLSKEMAEYSIGCNVESTFSYVTDGDRQGGSFTARISDGCVTNAAQKLGVSGLALNLTMPELPQLRSGRCFFMFKRADLGNLHFDSCFSSFEMLRPGELSINRFVLNWCDGKVRAETVHLTPSNQVAAVTLHCDKLDVAKLLYQIGVGAPIPEAERAIDAASAAIRGAAPSSASTVSGALPAFINMRDGTLTLRDGYLYSKPGEKGRIFMAPSDTVASAADASVGTALAVDALSDFEYSWVRIGLNSDRDTKELVLHFELDGKPGKKLFYSATGSGVERSRTANIFKGITLDTTFRIPVNETLRLILQLTSKARH